MLGERLPEDLIGLIISVGIGLIPHDIGRKNREGAAPRAIKALRLQRLGDHGSDVHLAHGGL